MKKYSSKIKNNLKNCANKDDQNVRTHLTEDFVADSKRNFEKQFC